MISFKVSFDFTEQQFTRLRRMLTFLHAATFKADVKLAAGVKRGTVRASEAAMQQSDNAATREAIDVLLTAMKLAEESHGKNEG